MATYKEFDAEQYVANVAQMSDEEIQRELNNIINFEGEADPRVDELVIEVLRRELMIPDDILMGTQLDQVTDFPWDANPKENNSNEDN